MSRDFQLGDSKGWSLSEDVFSSVFGFEFSTEDLELCERLDPEESLRTPGESSDAS